MKARFLLLFFATSVSYASILEERPSELVISGTGGVASGGNGFNSVSLYGEYLHHLTGPIQLGAEVGLNYSWFMDQRGTTYSLLLGPTFNLSPDDVENSAFFTARGGALYSHFTSTFTRAVLDFGLGHRFQIFDNVVYRPQVTMQRIFSGPGSGWTAGIEPLAFSIVF